MMVRGSRAGALLARGERVAIVATGFACRPEALERGVDVVARLGFRPVVGRHALDRAAYFAGDDAARLDDLNRALADRTIRGIWCARGGYGTARLLAGVDWDAWARDPKILIGYSDVSALVSGALARTRALSLHGPVVAELRDPAAWHAPSLRASLAGRDTTPRVARRQVLVPGRAQGRLVGGNLTVLCHETWHVRQYFSSVAAMLPDLTRLMRCSAVAVVADHGLSGLLFLEQRFVDSP